MEYTKGKPSSGIDILEQNFNLLSTERKTLLRDYLQNLVSMQNTMAEVASVDNGYSSAKEKTDG